MQVFLDSINVSAYSISVARHSIEDVHFFSDSTARLNCGPIHGREMRVKYALSNSFGFGGHNGCLVVGGV